MISELRYQIFEIVTRPSAEPIYSAAGKLAKLQGMRETGEVETVRHLLGHGAIPLDAELMAQAHGYEPWQSATSDSKP
jgi:hypothetical protein